MELRKKITELLETSYLTRINNLEHSIALAQEALGICDGAEFSDLKAKAYSQLSLYFMIIGNYESSSVYAKESIRLYEELQDEKGIADAKYSIAGIYYKTNNYHLGLVYLVDALSIYKKVDDFHNISRCEKSLGTIYEFFEDKGKAVESYKNAIAAAKKANDINLKSNAYNNLSGIYIKMGAIDTALELIERSVVMKKESGDVRGLAFAIYGRGKVFLAQKRYSEAEENFKEAIAIHTEMNERLGIVMAYQKLAKLYVEINRLKEAKDILEKGLAIMNQYNITIIKFKAYFLFYTIYKLEHNTTQALAFLELYLKEKESVLNTQTLKIIDSYDMLVQIKTQQKEDALNKEKAEMLERNKRSEESARARQEFLSTMSHEIRTPLNAVTTIVSMMHDGFDIQNKELIEPLKFSTNHLMNIINDILDFTKLDLGKVALELQPVDLKTLIANFKQTYEIAAHQKDIDFQVELDANLANSYWLDETKIIQILGNLVGNAIKFTDNGKVTLEVKRLKQDDFQDEILFEVTDTGEGIEKDKLNLIFDSFSQIKNVTTRKKGGTGLGLAIVKNLVALYDSEIKVASTYGEGSVFSFILTLKKHNAATINKTSNHKQPLFEGKKLLLVEDNAINAFIAKSLISKWGIEVDHALNGSESIEKAINTEYDFILMDIHMPEMDGFEATKIIRSTNDYNKNVPIFGLTADISAKDNIAYNSYFNGFLLKPLEIEKLQAALAMQNELF